VLPPLSGMFPHVHLSSLIELESWNPAVLQQVEHSPLNDPLIVSTMCAHTSRSMYAGTLGGVPERPPSDDGDGAFESEPHAPAKTSASEAPKPHAIHGHHLMRRGASLTE
jgi:hypothetical protein